MLGASIMWFDILKLNLSQLNVGLQGDTQGQKINVPDSTKCLDKLLNFAKKVGNIEEKFPFLLMRVYALEKNHEKQMPEFVACKLVDMIDKMFSQNSDIYEDSFVSNPSGKDDVANVGNLVKSIFHEIDYSFEKNETLSAHKTVNRNKILYKDAFIRISSGYYFQNIYEVVLSNDLKLQPTKIYKEEIMAELKKLWEAS